MGRRSKPTCSGSMGWTSWTSTGARCRRAGCWSSSAAYPQGAP
nr:MAG TPA: hypothetical protein [Caudoviricetes sp.]